MRNIYLDESGNTGAALLDAKQPTFTLSSNDYSDEEASELIKCVTPLQGIEIKFSSLKKSNKGRKRILTFFDQEIITNERVKTTIFHKRFMALTKIVDLLVENVAYEAGMDIYKNGMNIAISNMHYHCMPTFCGEEEFNSVLESFVKMIRERSEESINEFYTKLKNLCDSSTDNEYKESFAPILASKEIINDIVGPNDYLSLDPAIPSLFNHCTAWGDQLEQEFVVVHDVSKPIRAQLGVFNAFMNKEVTPEEVGYDRRKFTIPLRAKEINLEDSKNHQQLQVADIVASATAYVVNAIATDNHDDFSNALRGKGLEELAINVIWPSLDVTPEQMGTQGVAFEQDQIDAIKIIRPAII